MNLTADEFEIFLAGILLEFRNWWIVNNLHMLDRPAEDWYEDLATYLALVTDIDAVHDRQIH